MHLFSTGTMAMPRSLVDGLTEEQGSVDSDREAVDATLLPPG